MVDPAHELTDKKLEEMEKRLAAIYSRSRKEIKATSDAYFEKLKKLDAQKVEEMKAGNITKEEYKAWRRKKMLYTQRAKDMREQAAQQLLHVNETAVAYINDQLPEVYALNYNWSAKEIEMASQQAVSFELVDAQTVKNLVVDGDRNLLPFKELDPAKDITWNMKSINAELLQGIIQGESIPKIAARIANVETMNLNSAVRTARTIATNAENKARQDSAEKAAEKGVVLKKVWLTVADKRTRDWHKTAGQQYSESNAIPIDKPFIVDGEELMYPGDNEHGASGYNLYNCRCARKNIVVGFKSILPPEKRGKIKVVF